MSENSRPNRLHIECQQSGISPSPSGCVLSFGRGYSIRPDASGTIKRDEDGHVIISFEDLYVSTNDYVVDGREEESVHCHEGFGQFPLKEILDEEEGGLKPPDKGQHFLYHGRPVKYSDMIPIQEIDAPVFPLDYFCKMEEETKVEPKKIYHYKCSTTCCSG